jgi:multimeric flavodoxin WrbA
MTARTNNFFLNCNFSIFFLVHRTITFSWTILPGPFSHPQLNYPPGRILSFMVPGRELLQSVSVKTDDREYHLSLYREDFSALYPGMFRYVIEATTPQSDPARFITNTYEYSPSQPGSAESAARQTLAIWEEDLKRDPAILFREYSTRLLSRPAAPKLTADLVILQGSPRPDGNNAILAQWAVEAANGAGKTSMVIYPHDLDIHPCIGCYQCYNTGTCVFNDDMNDIIAAVRDASLIIVCSPVYTNTVPAGLKLVIDRMQAYHAERALFGGRTGQQGLIYSIAGRKGKENFTCITRVLIAFFHTLGVAPAGEVLIDSADVVHDIHSLPGKEEGVKKQVQTLL